MMTLINNIKAVLFDADGVIITREEYFSEYLSRYLNIDAELILEFFKGDFKKALVGEADLKEILKPYLPKWNFTGTVEELMELWFTREDNFDTRFDSIFHKLREAGTKLCLATKQEKYRLSYMREKMKFNYKFDFIFGTCDFGILKKEPGFYEQILQTLNLDPSEVVLVDDDMDSISSAKSLGINTFFYENFEDFNLYLSQSILK